MSKKDKESVVMWKKNLGMKIKLGRGGKTITRTSR